MDNLVIVESPAKVKTIEKFLGKGYKVSSSVGHIRDLKKKTLSIDIENNFTPSYEITNDKAKVVAELRKYAQKANKIFLATDPDREGEAIAWHLKEILQEKSKAQFFRVNFNEITKTSVLNAFKNQHQIDDNRVYSQQTRRIIDRIVGFKVSPLLWSRGAKSAGRVQTVALRLIVERENAIREFKPQEYWSLRSLFISEQNNKNQLETQLVKIDNKKLNLTNKQETDETIAEINNREFFVKEITSKKKLQYAPPPFITSTLQQFASSRISFPPNKTMKVAQELYEGINTSNQETTGLITYMRTDSFNVSKEAQQQTKDFIIEKWGAEFYPKKNNIFKSKSNAQEAHEAIRPTNINLDPQKLKSVLTTDQFKLYSLIWNRFVSSQMANAIFQQDNIDICDKQNKFLFRATKTNNIFPGYLKVDESNKKDYEQLPSFKHQEKCLLKTLTPKQHWTEPPARFSEATLIKELESNGVGRPSTYASIISTIKNRNYVEKEKGKIFPTQIGEDTSSFLVKNLDKLFDVKFTANMEEQLDKIELGEKNWINTLEKFYESFSKWLNDTKKINAANTADVVVFIDSLKNIKLDNSNKKFNDEKFVNDLQKKIDKEEIISEKQFNYLKSIVVKHKNEISTFNDLKDKYCLQEIEVKFSTNEQDLELISILDDIEFPPPQNNSKFNPKDFFLSLKNQASKKSLSQKQKDALIRMIHQYQNLIKPEIYNSFSKQYPNSTNNSQLSPEIKDKLNKIFNLSNNITWAEPYKIKNQTYSDESFFNDLKQQFIDKNFLSPKQLFQLKKILSKYKKQFDNIEL